MRIRVFLFLASIALAAAACNGDSGTETTPRTPSSDGGNGGESVNTGVPALDHTLNAALDVDRIELAGLAGYQRIGCVEVAEEVASRPVCRDGEEPDQPVEAFPVLQCDLAWVRPEIMPDVFGEALGAEPELVAVYEPVDQPLVLDSDYVGVFDTVDDESRRAGIAMAIKEGRVIQVEYDCGDFDGLYADEKVQRFLIQPETAEPSPVPDGDEPVSDGTESGD
jgi:hypothetical protein